MELQAFLPYLVHLGALVYVVCFLFRDQLWLRSFAILGDLFYMAFYFGSLDDPFWPMSYNLLSVLVNFAMIGVLLHDQRERPLDDRDMLLYQAFAGMSPGDFRRFRAKGVWTVADAETPLVTEGQAVDHLHYILVGAFEITKSGRQIAAEGPRFIGEIAYLQNVPATASVRAMPGCTYISWHHAALEAVTSRHDGLRQSLARLLSADLAMKVAKS